MVAAPGRVVDTGAGGFGSHGLRWLLQGDEHANFRVFAFDHTSQVSHVLNAGVTAFDGEDDLFLLATRPLVENI